jgi:hypothetical protein
MSSIEPIASNPYHIARAYQSLHAQQGVAAGAPQSAAKSMGVARLVGGVVAGRVDFAGSEPAPSGALAMYRHPADKNTAATAVHAGRLLDATA